MIGEWLYDQNGDARLYLEEDRLISKSGKYLGRIEENLVYSINDEILGSFDNGVIYDNDSRPIVFFERASGYIPTTTEIFGGDPDNSEFIPTDEDLTSAPGDPGISGVPYKPVSGDWSDMTLEEFFGTDL